jgi:hypothetical protein
MTKTVFVKVPAPKPKPLPREEVLRQIKALRESWAKEKENA